VGESGCGKSTLANLVVGLGAPTSGRMILRGEELCATRSPAQRRWIAFVQQNPYGALNPKHSIGHSIALPLIIDGTASSKERRRRVDELLELVGLPANVADRKPRSLSGGQRQRVAIARALAVEPDLIVLDEPTSALDVSVQARILALLTELQERLGLTYLLITHDLGIVRVMAHRVGVLYRGRLLEEADPETLFRRPDHPYTNLLLSSVPTVDPRDNAMKPSWPEMAASERQDISVGCNFRDRCPFAVNACETEAAEDLRDVDGRSVRCIRARDEWASMVASAPEVSLKASM